MKVTKEPFGTTPAGDQINSYTLKNSNGVIVKVINFGATITSIEIPSSLGVQDVVLGFDHLEGYLENPAYFGSTVGRYANRIAGGKFSIDGKEYTLAQNNGNNNLHGGPIGFHKKVWSATINENSEKASVTFSFESPDGDQGFPGNLKCSVTFSLTEDSALEIEYHATTDKTTVVNLTNHSYFNLKDGGQSQTLDHHIQIDANQITDLDENGIPTGILREVNCTPYDFKTAVSVRDRLMEFEGEKKGFDDNYVLNNQSGKLEKVGEISEPESGRKVLVFTTKPGIQFYTAEHLSGIVGKNNQTYKPYYGLCLETQYYPDSPNQPDFPSTLLRPENSYDHKTIYKFEF